MAIVFTQVVKHPGCSDFTPKTVYGFEDEDAEAYFVAAFGAVRTDDEPDVVISAEQCDIDPDTIHNETGLKVTDLVVQAEA